MACHEPPLSCRKPMQCVAVFCNTTDDAVSPTKSRRPLTSLRMMMDAANIGPYRRRSLFAPVHPHSLPFVVVVE
jgi:hypothetical protein